MTYTERALQLRPVMEQAAQSLDDAVALTAMELFPVWKVLVEKAHKVQKGFRFQYNDKLYRTEQPEYTFVEHYVPGSTGTESLFSLVDETHSGLRLTQFLLRRTWKSTRVFTTNSTMCCISAPEAVASRCIMTWHCWSAAMWR